jgi:hypothetical protein
MKERSVSFRYYWLPQLVRRKNVLTWTSIVNLWLRFMPSVAKRKQKNTQIARQKKMEREKEAKKKQLRQQLPAKGKKR